MTLAPGARLGPYEITASLGEGGMGAVYRATDTRLKREVAIKVLLPDVAHDPERLARFEREAQMLAALNHPHIAAIHGVEQAGGTTALVMELVEGLTLEELIAQASGVGLQASGTRRDGLPIDEALAIARQIADAIEAAHEQGIVHRDLKPANIKVREDGTVKVLDFGLAKALAGSESGIDTPGLAHSPTITSPALTLRGVILGTAAYMAPEQAKGRAVDRRADIWSFGCVLYEMLAGTRAFDGEDITEILGAIVKTDPEWRRLPADTPASLRRVLARCLVKDPRKRLQHIGDARLEIDDALSGAPADMATASAPSTAPRGARPRERAAWGLVVLAVAAAAWLALRPGPAPERLPPVGRFSLEIPAGSDAGTVFLALSQAGEHIALQSNRNPAEGTRIFIRRLDSPAFLEVPGSEGLRLRAWSRDDTSLLAITRPGLAGSTTVELRRGDVATGQARTVARVPESVLFASAAEGTDGALLLSVAGQPLHVIDAGGETPRPRGTLEAGEFEQVLPVFLPDGRRFF